MARPKALKYMGTITEVKDEQGRVIRREADRFFSRVPVPTRDLDEADIAHLSDEQLAEITGGSDPLYVEPKPKSPKVPEKPAVETSPEKPETDTAESSAAENAGDA